MFGSKKSDGDDLEKRAEERAYFSFEVLKSKMFEPQAKETKAYPSVIPPKVVRVSRPVPPALYILLAAFLGATLLSFIFYAGPVTSTPLPFGNTVGLAVNGNQAYTADWFRKNIFVHDVQDGMRIVSIGVLDNEMPLGLAFDGTHLWSLDSLNEALLRHDIKDDFPVLEKYPTPGGDPAGLFWHGGRLWSADKEANTIYRHNANDPEIIEHEYEIPNASLDAFAIQDNRAWVMDGSSFEMTVYRLSAPVEPIKTFNVAPFINSATPTGLHITDSQVWILTKNPSRLFKIPRRKLHRSRTDTF